MSLQVYYAFSELIYCTIACYQSYGATQSPARESLPYTYLPSPAASSPSCKAEITTPAPEATAARSPLLLPRLRHILQLHLHSHFRLHLQLRIRHHQHHDPHHAARDITGIGIVMAAVIGIPIDIIIVIVVVVFAVLADVAPYGLTQGEVEVFLGNGDGTLQQPVSFVLNAPNPAFIAAGDFNGDGIPDLAAAAERVAQAGAEPPLARAIAAASSGLHAFELAEAAGFDLAALVAEGAWATAARVIAGAPSELETIVVGRDGRILATSGFLGV